MRDVTVLLPFCHFFVIFPPKARFFALWGHIITRKAPFCFLFAHFFVIYPPKAKKGRRKGRKGVRSRFAKNLIIDGINANLAIKGSGVVFARVTWS